VASQLPESHSEWPLLLQFTLDANLLGKCLAPELLEIAYRGEEEAYLAQVEKDKQKSSVSSTAAVSPRSSGSMNASGHFSFSSSEFDPSSPDASMVMPSQSPNSASSAPHLPGSGLTSADLLNMSMYASMADTTPHASSESGGNGVSKTGRIKALALHTAEAASKPKANYKPKSDPSTLYKLDRSTLEKLPLELFDDADEFETRAPQEWLEVGPAQGLPATTGRSLFYLHPHFVWLPCEVLAYDEDEQKYLVSFFTEDDMRASPMMQPALEELLQVRDMYFMTTFVRCSLYPDVLMVAFLCTGSCPVPRPSHSIRF
jgi:hypothetical protein